MPLPQPRSEYLVTIPDWLTNGSVVDPFSSFFFSIADWSPASEKRCVESGFDGVLHKPIVLSGLDEFLSSVVRGEFPRAEVK